jgi:hypothetical protein
MKPVAPVTSTRPAALRLIWGSATVRGALETTGGKPYPIARALGHVGFAS